MQFNDIFVLGGRTYQFIESNRSTVVVKDGLGRKPTVPSWSGEMLPRSFDLSESVGKFRAEVEKKLVTPLTEGFQAVIWHCLVSDPKLQVKKTKW